ncbi:MAG: hypothetical protein EOO29_07160 [Comamonadaceae bacterium]|nr:MAG: hypothetical protein EOO29_07160 [Comamonadaceae bacterium]
MSAFHTFCIRHRSVLAGLLIAGAATQAVAQDSPAAFPAEASRFIESEWPRMSSAVAAQDRSYFEGAMARTVELAERWGFKTRANPSLAAYGACTDAVSDLVVVGLCRLTPSASECTPNLASGFEQNRAACRTLAGR